MTELLAPFAIAPEVVEQPADIAEASPRTPVLITEQQVLFATAAALPLQPAKTSRRWTEVVRAIGANVRAAVATSSDEARPTRRQYPPRNDFLADPHGAGDVEALSAAEQLAERCWCRRSRDAKAGATCARAVARVWPRELTR